MKNAQRRPVIAIVLVAFACTSPPAGEQPPADTAPVTGTIDNAMVAKLEQEARALAKTEGCASTGQCKAAPMGAKACGGPRAWIVYCPLATDEVGLTRKLDELRAAEERYNRETGLVSDCAMLNEPSVELSNGVCRSAP